MLRIIDMLRKIIQSMELPANPLDQLIMLMGGPSKVAEMTGRKGQLVKEEEGGVQYQKRRQHVSPPPPPPPSLPSWPNSPLILLQRRHIPVSAVSLDRQACYTK